MQGKCIMNEEYDPADHKLLRLVQRNCRTNLDILANECGLSIPSVQRRLKKLRDKGVIKKEIAIIAGDKLGYTMSFIVMVELERESLDQLNAFKKRVRLDPRVQQCYYVTGEADFVLICVTRDMQDFEALTHKLFFNVSNVRRFRTSIIMGQSKVSLEIPC